ncbi:unnamed protein product [Cuscuta epithymum]|uniref:Uncharacterized protein n=1 Tax=Cuscuta epithymum TaxID=186058 RepID=A0AAV0ECE2_9ASTE|nr:unnamed protein product [Cuscuta epithymum]CAH9121529.1 unnamed protein product [Cuscuta epithymum]
MELPVTTAAAGRALTPHSTAVATPPAQWEEPVATETCIAPGTAPTPPRSALLCSTMA